MAEPAPSTIYLPFIMRPLPASLPYSLAVEATYTAVPLQTSLQLVVIFLGHALVTKLRLTIFKNVVGAFQ